MMACRSYTLLLFSLMAGWSAASSASAKAFLPRRHASMNKDYPLLKLRGGAILDIDPVDVVKVTTGVSLVHGAINYLAPGPTCDFYGVKSSKSTRFSVEYLMKNIGLCLIAMSILSYAVINKDVAIDKAVGVSLIPSLVATCASILNEDAKKMGADEGPSWLAVALVSFWVYGASQSWAPLSTKTAAGFFLLQGAWTYLATDSSFKAWGDAKRDAASLTVCADYGLWMFTYGVLIAALAMDVDPIKAYSYSRLVPLYRSVMNLIGSDVKKLGMDDSKQLFWLAYNVIVVALLFL